MSAADLGAFQPASMYHPRRKLRVVLGPLFGAACLLATMTGVVVLALLLGSVAARVLQQGAQHDLPWHDLAGNARRLLAFLTALVDHKQSSNPALAGFRMGLAGSFWLLGLVTAFAHHQGLSPPPAHAG